MASSLLSQKKKMCVFFSGARGNSVLCDGVRIQRCQLAVRREEDAASRLVHRHGHKGRGGTGLQTPLPQPPGRHHQVRVCVCTHFLSREAVEKVVDYNLLYLQKGDGWVLLFFTRDFHCQHLW